MVDIDVLKAQLVRQDPSEPWGFRLIGGTDFNDTLSIVRIIPGSPAAKIGLEPGDEIVEIGDRNTATLTQQQALDLIESHADTLTMTVERRVTNSNQPPRFVTTAQVSPTQPYKSYQPLDLTGSSRHVVSNSNHIHPGFDFQTVQARPFEAARPKSSVQSHQSPAQHDIGEYYDTPVHHVSTDNEYFLPCPQSRTFRMLQTVMHNEEPAAGVSGLPPPRSATMEYMRQQQRQSGGQRVKVFMPQQYNSPMGMYSAHNVLETFTAQAETMLDTIERRHL